LTHEGDARNEQSESIPKKKKERIKKGNIETVIAGNLVRTKTFKRNSASVSRKRE